MGKNKKIIIRNRNDKRGAQKVESRLIPVLKALEEEHVILTVELTGGGQDGKKE